ncbi:MAG: hypothetical protein V4629_10635 [Pseudomonadota bacterium]
MTIERQFQFIPTDTGQCYVATYQNTDKKSTTGIILVPPIGHEYFRCHHWMTETSVALAEQGFYVLRLDGPGQGDSTGDWVHSTPQQWIDAINVVKTWGRDHLAIRRWAALGIRMGGSLLQLASLQNLLTFRVIAAWQPIVQGTDYLNNLRAAHQVMIRDHRRFWLSQIGNTISESLTKEWMQKNIQQNNAEECLGFYYGPSWLEWMQAITMKAMAPASQYQKSQSIWLSDKHTLKNLPEATAHIDGAAGSEWIVQTTEDDINWFDPNHIEQRIYATDAKMQLVDALVKYAFRK